MAIDPHSNQPNSNGENGSNGANGPNETNGSNGSNGNGSNNAANEPNATGPAGPRTPEGKAISSQNALKLGLSIQRHVVLSHEDPEEYDALRDTIHAIYQPQSPREALAIDDVAQCRWAFRRFDEAEATALHKATRHTVGNPQYPYTYGQVLGGLAEPQKFEPSRYDPLLDQKPRPMLDIPLWPGLNNLQRYRTWWERKHIRALAEFERACQSRRQQARDDRDAAWHATRLQAATHRAESHHQRTREREAAERRRDQLHALRLAKHQAALNPKPPAPQPSPAPSPELASQNTPPPAPDQRPAADASPENAKTSRGNGCEQEV